MELQIWSNIFQQDSFSPPIFVIEIIPLNYLLNKCKGSKKFTKSEEKISHLIHMDDIKIFAKNERELEIRM